MEHGHRVLELIHENDAVFTPEQLRTKLYELYGENVLFYTCSDEGMTFEQLMCFLFERGKIALVNGVLTMYPEKMCNHDH